MNSDELMYKQKYLKYKQKYLELKQNGGFFKDFNSKNTLNNAKKKYEDSEELCLAEYKTKIIKYDNETNRIKEEHKNNLAARETARGKLDTERDGICTQMSKRMPPTTNPMQNDKPNAQVQNYNLSAKINRER